MTSGQQGSLTLVRVVSPTGHRPHVHEGMIVCFEHLRQLELSARPPIKEIPDDQAAFWGHRCLMCGVDAAPGRVCENVDCRRTLHPQWPAVYCCNDCALEDA